MNRETDIREEIRERLKQALLSWDGGKTETHEERFYRDYWIMLSPKLPEHERKAVELRYIHKREWEDIAAEWGIKPKSVKRYVSHGLLLISNLIYHSKYVAGEADKQIATSKYINGGIPFVQVVG